MINYENTHSKHRNQSYLKTEFSGYMVIFPKHNHITKHNHQLSVNTFIIALSHRLKKNDIITYLHNLFGILLT